MICLLAVTARADEKKVRLAAQSGLQETGLFKHMLPRFSLKTGIRIELVASFDEADAAFATDGYGDPVFERDGTIWWLEVIDDHKGARRFSDWLQSEVGQRTVTGYRRDGVQIFTLPEIVTVVAAETTVEGDAVQGLALSTQHCGRCHVVSEETRMNAIGSTPSFFVLRTFGNWEERFQSFFALKPHPAFTQIDGVTDPFPANRPSPIYPLEITLNDLDAILAYVSQLEPADLGSPIRHQ